MMRIGLINISHFQMFGNAAFQGKVTRQKKTSGTEVASVLLRCHDVPRSCRSGHPTPNLLTPPPAARLNVIEERKIRGAGVSPHSINSVHVCVCVSGVQEVGAAAFDGHALSDVSSLQTACHPTCRVSACWAPASEKQQLF